MQDLEALLKTFGRRRGARWWIGAKPDVREGKVAKAIAAQIQLPAASCDPAAMSHLVTLSRSDAAWVLAIAGTTSLAYGPWRPRVSALQRAREALSSLGEDAVFLGNGDWKEGSAFGWTRLTDATFDCGLIAFDANLAFIFWVEEED